MELDVFLPIADVTITSKICRTYVHPEGITTAYQHLVSISMPV
jgi:hypothetical protein